MNDKQKTRISKFMSLVLRHKPEEAGLTLDENGWTQAAPLWKVIRDRIDPDFTAGDLIEIVDTNEKKRFELSKDFHRIRAAQGHSVEVDLALEPQTPPKMLMHGTQNNLVSAIYDQGLIKGSRNHVHLSEDLGTTIKVGKRRGPKVAVISVMAAEMAHAGHKFYKSSNGVWLTDHVPAKYLFVHGYFFD